MTVDGMYKETAAFFFLVFLALSWVTVDGAIYSRKNRKDTPEKVDFRQVERLLLRNKRAATSPANSSTTPPGTSNQVVLDQVVLNGTENHYTAYVHWSGREKSDVIFILTVQSVYSGFADSQVWKSADYGSTFTTFSFGRGALVSYFYVSPADSTKMVFMDTRCKCMYTTRDELASYQNVSLPVASDDIYMHPTQADWMLLLDYRNRELYATVNFGASWTLLQSDVQQFFWGVPGVDADPHTIHLEIQHKDTEDSFYMRCTIPYCNSTGDGIDINLGPFLPYTLLVSDEYIFAQKVIQEGKESHMMVSYRRGNFSNAYFPDSVKTQDFMVLDTSEGQVFLAVNHGDRQGASLYLSDQQGQYYVLSLSNVHHRSFSYWFDVDMHKVKGLNGTYLANQQSVKNPSKLISYVSLNKGGKWDRIQSPRANCNDDNCSMVLSLDMNYIFTNWILSNKRAPNFIIAHGQYGSGFQSGWSNLSIFTSIDGGWTWKESPLQGLYHFNILDQGSIVTAIETSFMENTTQVYYSVDEGNSWQSQKFKNETLHVVNVLNEPDINTVVLSVYGRVNYSAPWTVVKLNFSQVLSRKCNDDDYTNWSPSDHDSTLHENCLLGQLITYKYKKATSVCYNGKDFVRSVNKNPCECTAEDFECDFGFSMKDDVCVKESWFDDSFISPECTENENYTKSNGYRKVVSDKCIRGVENDTRYQHTSTICPLVQPDGLIISANVTVVAVGQPVLFHLIQKRGSVQKTQYQWNFSHFLQQPMTGLSSAQHKVMTFWSPATYNVNVNASNSKGSSTSNSVTIKVEIPIHSLAVFSVRTARVGDPVTVVASTWTVGQDNALHYQFRFGDEAPEDRDVLSYFSNATHWYSRPGDFTLTVTALNSISAVTKQVSIHIIDDGIVAQLTFSPNVDRMFFGSYITDVYLERIQEELTVILGVMQDRLALSLNSSHPIRLNCLIVPKPAKAPVDEKTAEQIAKDLLDMVKNEALSLFLDTVYTRWYGDINVTEIVIMDYSRHNHGCENMSTNCTDNQGHNCTNCSHNCTNCGHNCTNCSHNCTNCGHNCTNCGHNCTNCGHNCTNCGHNCIDCGHNCTNCGHNCTNCGCNCMDNTTHHDDHSNSDSVGINYRTIYIAVSVVAVAGIITALIIVIYRRKSRIARYSLLNRNGSTDPYFDEEDDLPLDMADARDTDDRILDIRTGN